MSGCLLTSDAGGREVLTVNVNQINQDLIRQVNTVLSQHTSDIGQPSATPLPTPCYGTGGPSSQAATSIGVGSTSHHNFGGHQSQGSIGPSTVPISGGGSGLNPISLPSLSSRR